MYDLLLEASKAESNLALLVKTCSLNDYDIIRVSCGCRQADWELPHSSTVTAAHMQLSCTTAHEKHIMVGSDKPAIFGFELVGSLHAAGNTHNMLAHYQLILTQGAPESVDLRHQRFICHFITRLGNKAGPPIWTIGLSYGED